MRALADNPQHHKLEHRMMAYGIVTPPSELIADGEIHRFVSVPGHKGAAGWYIVHPDPIASTWAFGDWRLGIRERGEDDPGRVLTPEEIADRKQRLRDLQAKITAEEQRFQAGAAIAARQRWDKCAPATAAHGYLKAKRIDPCGTRVDGDALLVPMHDIDGKLWSLQEIASDGHKYNQESGRRKGCFFQIGEIGDTFCVGEGFSTCGTLHMATGFATVSAGEAGNLEVVAKMLREKYPTANMVICGDDDWLTKVNGKPRNVGKLAAQKTAEAVRGVLAPPWFGPARPAWATDFNDMGKLCGAEEVATCIKLAMVKHGEDLHAAQASKSPPTTSEDFGLSPANAADVDRPTIEIRGDHLVKNIEATETAILANSTQPIFQRGGRLVRILRLPKAEIQGGVLRAADAPTIFAINAEWLRCRMNECVRFVKRDGRTKQIIDKDPPFEYATALLSRNGTWRFPPLLAVIEAPTLRVDGTVLQTPGYDDTTGLYFDPGAMTFEPVLENPSRDDALRSLAELKDLLRDFPFVDDVALAVALAALITGLTRRSFPTAPMILFDAPTRSSGKTLLARTVAHLSTGREAAPMTFTTNHDDERKRLIAVLTAGNSVLVYDNISHPLEGDALCSVLTQPTFQDRRLGVNEEMITVPTCALFLGTGNNLTVRGDLASRVLISRIDPQVERPEEREFDRELLLFIRDHRQSLVRAALTIPRAYVAAGRPRQPIKPYGRFEEWSDMVRAALVWIGIADPCLSRGKIERDDPITEAHGFVLMALFDKFGAMKFTTAEVMREALGGATTLQQALEAALPRGEIKSRPIGIYLKTHKDRFVSGLRVRDMGSRQGVTLWGVEET